MMPSPDVSAIRLPFPPPQCQPRPLNTSIVRHVVAGQPLTAIARVWRPEDVPRCKLCPECTACPTTGLCLVTIEEWVEDSRARLYSLVGRRVDRE